MTYKNKNKKTLKNSKYKKPEFSKFSEWINHLLNQLEFLTTKFRKESGLITD